MGRILDLWVNASIRLSEENLTSKDGRVDAWIDNNSSFDKYVANGWQLPIIEVDAKLLTRRPGKILNVGYGMGFMDKAIRRANPEQHTIVEIHPEIAQNARDAGFTDVYEGDWFDFVKQCKKNNVKYDAIYFDGYCFDNRPDWQLFTMNVNDLLEDDGLYCYFNGEDAYQQEVKQYLLDHMWSISEQTSYKVVATGWLNNKKSTRSVNWKSISWKK